jgi:DNA-binding IclR family transcriptional regulator
VVAVLALLAEPDAAGGLTTSAISRRLGITNSTCAAILAAFESTGWAVRSADKRYVLGPAIVPVAQAVLRRHPVVADATARVQSLNAELGMGCVLIELGRHENRIVAVAGSPDQFAAVSAIGDRQPTYPPFGSVSNAFRSAAEIERWLDTAPRPLTPRDRREYRESLVGIRERGWSVSGSEPHLTELVEAYEEIRSHLAATPDSQALQRQLAAFFTRIVGRGYMSAELVGRPVIRVEFVSAPVFDEQGDPTHELVVHVLRPAMQSTDLEQLALRLVSVTNALSAPRRADATEGVS